MNKMIVTVFDTEEKAFEGLSALKSLHDDGDVTIHATAVISKDESGEVSVKEAADEGLIGTSVGVFSGALIGLIGGPVGVAMGATTGMLGGMYYDLSQSGIDAGFVDEVSEALSENKVAVVADVEEGWTAPVDTRIKALDGMVFRRNRSEVVEDQLNREAEEISAELDELEQELKEARDDAKASIQHQIAAAQEKRMALKKAAEQKKEHLIVEMAAKTKALSVQIKEAKESNRKKLEKRKADLTADFERRKNKLNAAAHKAAEFVA